MSEADDSRKRRARLERASPLYTRLLQQHPEYLPWLEDPRNLRAEFRYRALSDEWAAFQKAVGALESDEAELGCLRRWRRLISLRIAYRSVNDLASEQTCVEELSRLAEFCVRTVYGLARARWAARAGEPWDDTRGAPALFSVLALGKLGGQELNFSSDIDLIFVHQGDGECRHEGPARLTTREFFTKIGESLIAMLGASTADGFLFRVDARLRPEGATGALVPSAAAMENYYATSGQTWERLALLKARPIAGDLELGAEVLEALHTFRYPRHPPLSLLAEIAAMKRRTEEEIVGASGLNRDIKRGRGGIREIEFVAQSLQILHAGRYPFLQTHATTVALEQGARYGLFAPEQARSLIRDYWMLRRVEHRIQMREEAQTHELPKSRQELAEVAHSLGFESPDSFLRELDAVQGRVHRLYGELFADLPTNEENEAWWRFLTSERTPPLLAPRLQRWFGDDPAAVSALKALAQGGAGQFVSRDLVGRFQHLAKVFDELFPQLGRPVDALRRLERFADRYGSRRQFFEMYAGNPQLFRVLALLFDRSAYIHELLCAHPEILEEVLRPEILRRRKSGAELAAELAEGPDGQERKPWLWLYTRAEQVRYAVGELLGMLTEEEVESSLSLLADAVLRDAVLRCGGTELLVVALGKYGGAEMTFGSDLDVIFVAEEAQAAHLGKAVEAVRALLATGGPLLPALPLDLRLRPHGEAGPLVVSEIALRTYHESGQAQLWEKQLLTRARVLAGPDGLARRWTQFTDAALYARPVSATEEESIRAMRLRIARERDAVQPPQRAFKTGLGGLVSFEFLAQTLQLRHGTEHPSLRRPATRAVLRESARLGLMPPAIADELLANYGFLKRIEIMVRRDSYSAASVLAAAAEERRPLARWLGFADEDSFWSEHVRRMRDSEDAIGRLAAPNGSSAIKGPG